MTLNLLLCSHAQAREVQCNKTGIESVVIKNRKATTRQCILGIMHNSNTNPVMA